MAKKKVYAVKKGRKTGVFYSWNACSSMVTGVSGAEYKGFSTEEEARAYLGDKQQEITVPGEEHLIAYVDGSFDVNAGRYSFGCVLLTPDGKIIKESGNGDNPDSLAIRNVAGEMLGAMYAVKWAAKNGYKSIELRYDYVGIEKWARGEWKTNHVLTGKYAAYMKHMEEYVQISFQKVKAHSGDLYNEEADKLAKAALTGEKGIPPISKA